MNPRTIDLQRNGLRRVIADAIAIKKGDPHEIATQRWGAGRPPFVDALEQRAGVSGSVSGDASPFRDEVSRIFRKRQRRLRCQRDGTSPRSLWRETCQRDFRRNSVLAGKSLAKPVRACHSARQD